MPDPIKGLQQAAPPPKAVPPVESSWPHQIGDAILGTSNAALGMVGLGPDGSANRFGQMVGAGLPGLGKLESLYGEMVPVTENLEPHVKGLVEALHQTLPEPNLNGIAAGNRVTSSIPPRRTMLSAPTDVDFHTPEPYVRRQPGLQGLRDTYTKYHSAVFPPLDARSSVETANELPDVGQIDQAPVSRGIEDLQDVSPQAPTDGSRKSLIQDTTAYTNTRNQAPRPMGQTKLKDISPDTIEQVQRAAGTGSYNNEQVKNMFPTLSQDIVRKILKMPWNWKP